MLDPFLIQSLIRVIGKGFRTKSGVYFVTYYTETCNFVKIRKGIDAIVSKFESKEVGKKSCCKIGKIDVGIFLYVSRDILIGFF